MTEPSANSQSEHPRPVDRRWAVTRLHLRKWFGGRRRSVYRHFAQGVAYQLGSGAVTLLILWWETRH